MIQKILNIETKAALKSSTIVQNSDIYYSKGHCPSNNTALKVQIQRIIAKNSSHFEKPKTKHPKSAPP